MNSTISVQPSSDAAPASPRPIARTSPTSFTHLFLEHSRLAKQARGVRRTITSQIWCARQLLKAMNWTEETDPVCIASDANFNCAVDQACARLGYEAKSQDARCLRSGAIRVRTTFLLLHEGHLTGAKAPEAFGDFWSAFQYYGKIAERYGYLGVHPETNRPRYATGGLLRNMGIREATVTALRRGMRCSLTEPLEERFQEVEKLLRTPPGALTRHITFRGGPNPEADRATAHSSRYSQAVRFRYGIAFAEWPKHLQDELNEFLRSKVGVKWTEGSDGYCGTADNILKKLNAFLGWLCLPAGDNVWRSGGGKKLADIKSLFAELVTPEILNRYREFRLAHTVKEEEYLNGERATVFNTSLRGIYHFAAELLKPPHKFKTSKPAGFVFRNPDRYGRLLEHLLPTTSIDPVTNGFIPHQTFYDRWVAFCQQTRGAFFDILDSAIETGKAGKSRPTDAGIEHILALPNPRTALAELLDAVRCDYDGYSWEATPHDKAYYCRRQVFFELLVRAPHRVRLWAMLTRRHFEERTNDAGERYFHLHIGSREFKNHRYLDSDYDLDLPVHLFSLMQTYFDRAWPILNAPLGTFQRWRDQNSGRIYQTDAQGNVVPIENDARYEAFAKMKPSDRLFGMAYGLTLAEEHRQVLTPEKKTKVIISNLQRLCQNSTCRFLGVKYKTNGFYPHACRHIVATDEIKTTGSYERAALLLWDSVEMVMQTYSHVKRTDLLAKAVESNESLFSPHGSAVKNGSLSLK